MRGQMFLESAAVAFGVILLAEIGDKTQIVLVTLALRGRKMALFLGAATAFLVLTAVAVAAADLVARLVPPIWIALIGAGLFFGFGVLTLREGILDRPEEVEDVPTSAASRGAFLTSFGLVAVAELGDKTQIAVAVLAANTGEPLAVGLGGWLALVLLAALALLLGGALARRFPRRTLRIVVGILFLLVGAGMLVLGIRDTGVGLGTLMWT